MNIGLNQIHQNFIMQSDEYANKLYDIASEKINNGINMQMALEEAFEELKITEGDLTELDIQQLLERLKNL